MKQKKTTQLKTLITRPELDFLLEVHSGLSAKVAEEAGFLGMWGSGLSISAASGVRDNNELSYTQVLEILEYITDATSIPLLLDGDTGYGNFNNMRRLVKKLESRGVAGVCIEDKLFPKTNSFIKGEAQPLADIEEFSGKIKAGKDAQKDDDFVIVARVEAFIAGWGLSEALKRAEAYRQAGADAILMHSSLKKPDEVLAFQKEWGDRLPVVIVPTKYYSTPTDVFREAGFSVAIWANHMMRTSITAMKKTAEKLHREQSLIGIEENIVTVAEVFRLQGAAELAEAEKKYLPEKKASSALILAASRGKELGALTEEQPKALVPIAGKPLLDHQLETLNAVGIKDITVVRGYKKEKVVRPNLKYVDNDQFESTQEVYSLAQGLENCKAATLVSYGDVLYQKFIPINLMESEADFAIAVDSEWKTSQNQHRYGDYVVCEKAFDRYEFNPTTQLKQMIAGQTLGEKDLPAIHGEWIGLLKLSENGVAYLKGMFKEISGTDQLKKMRMVDLMNKLMEKGKTVEVTYTSGHWVDVDELKDVVASNTQLEL